MKKPRPMVTGEASEGQKLGGFTSEFTSLTPNTQVCSAAIAREFGLSLAHASTVVELMTGAPFGRATR